MLRIQSISVAFVLSACAFESRAAEISVPDDFAKIQAAVNAANPGDLIVVRAGVYRESLTLKPGITLRSFGNDSQGKLGLARAEATLIEGGGAPAKSAGVTMAEGAILDGFTVANFGRYDEAEWKRHHATRGNDQPYEHIGAPGIAGVSIMGVNCEVRNNLVHHNGYTGIAITGAEGKTCSPLIVSNVCHRNMAGGIGSMNGSTATIRSNICFENFFAGIGHENASPLVEGNRCFQNIRAGIGISEGASPKVISNICYENRRAGIGIRTGANTRPTLERNDCHDNGMAGIGVDQNAQPVIRENRCFRNRLAGIGVRDHALPVIVGNESFENGNSGIGLMSGRQLLVASNYCHHNKTAGIGLASGSGNSASLIGNRLLENATVAVGINPGWTVVLAENELARTGGMPPIVMVFPGAMATFTNNTIRGGGVAGIRVGGVIKVLGNRFIGTNLRKAGPPNFAVWALKGARVEMHGNQIDSWRHALFADAAEVVATGNSVTNAYVAAFRIRSPSKPPRISDNKVAGANVQELLLEK